MIANIACPFCGDSGFDQVGLRGHLKGSYSILGGTPCEAYEAATDDASWNDYVATGRPALTGASDHG